MPRKSIPSMSVIAAHPFVDALRAGSCPDDLIARQLTVETRQIDLPKTMIPASTVYKFMAWAADYLEEPTLAAEIGIRMARGGWAPILPLIQKTRTVGDFLVQFSILAADQGGAAFYRLEVDGRNANWHLTRPRGATHHCRHADATATAFFVDLIKQSSCDEWDANELVAIIGGAHLLLPSQILPLNSVKPGKTGMKLSFPTRYLLYYLPKLEPNPNLPHVGVLEWTELDLVERVGQIIGRNIEDPAFDIHQVANSLGMTHWDLQQSLAGHGTNVSELKNNVRNEQAKSYLAKSASPINLISSLLGYSSSSNFIRAFRLRNGVTPNEYRRKMRKI